MGKAKMGAPRKYDRQAVLERVCHEMARGHDLEQICEAEDMPSAASIYLWITENTEESEKLFEIFNRAQVLWCWSQKDKLIRIADDESRDYYVDDKGVRRSDNTATGRDKLRIGARQWAMTRLAAKFFGEKLQQELSGPDGAALPGLKVVIEK